jgi:uncharacterized protein YyaL (SSP411 family)
MKHIQFLILTIALSVVASGNSYSQLPGYKERVDILQQQINNKLRDTAAALYYETTDIAKNENKHSYLWPLCAYIQAANEMETLEPGKDYIGPVVKAIDQYYAARPPYPGYQAYVASEKHDSRFYDDNQWVAIAYLDAYNRTHKKRYLEKSEMICRFILGGLDTVAGGGFYWKEDGRSTKNTCSNGPGILVLLQLYKITHKQANLTTAIQVYNWVNKTLQDPGGVYYDNINVSTLKIGRAKFTYNTGAMLQANVLLFDITKDKKYLNEAERVATAGRNFFFRNGRLPDGYWFNAVMLRGYEELYKVDANKEWINFYQQDADAIWNNERDANNMVGTKQAKSLIDQAAMIEIYARLALLKN